MKDLLKNLGKPIKVSGVQYFEDCGHEKKHDDRHRKCQKCRGQGGYLRFKNKKPKQAQDMFTV